MYIDECIRNLSLLQWSSLNALNSLPSLTELKFKDNPVTSGKQYYALCVYTSSNLVHHRYYTLSIHLFTLIMTC